jgi:predicted PurR-regulated permease PerM
MTLGIQALMSVLFGFIGLLVAVPLLAAILTIVRTMNEREVIDTPAETALDPILSPRDGRALARSSAPQ